MQTSIYLLLCSICLFPFAIKKNMGSPILNCSTLQGQLCWNGFCCILLGQSSYWSLLRVREQMSSSTDGSGFPQICACYIGIAVSRQFRMAANPVTLPTLPPGPNVPFGLPPSIQFYSHLFLEKVASGSIYFLELRLSADWCWPVQWDLQWYRNA